jgi:hypothetical protein
MMTSLNGSQSRVRAAYDALEAYEEAALAGCAPHYPQWAKSVVDQWNEEHIRVRDAVTEA